LEHIFLRVKYLEKETKKFRGNASCVWDTEYSVLASCCNGLLKLLMCPSPCLSFLRLEIQWLPTRVEQAVTPRKHFWQETTLTCFKWVHYIIFIFFFFLKKFRPACLMNIHPRTVLKQIELLISCRSIIFN